MPARDLLWKRVNAEQETAGQDANHDGQISPSEMGHLEKLGKELGGELTLHAFVRFELGEGIEKKVEDLAAEVAKMTGG